MNSIIGYIKYELLPEYTEKSQLTDLFLEHKLLGWLGLLTIFILISSILYLQPTQCDKGDKSENNKLNDWEERSLKEKK